MSKPIMRADFATAAAETSSRLFDNRFDPIESGVRSLQTGYERMQEQGAQDLPALHGRSRQFDRTPPIRPGALLQRASTPCGQARRGCPGRARRRALRFSPAMTENALALQKSLDRIQKSLRRLQLRHVGATGKHPYSRVGQAGGEFV